MTADVPQRPFWNNAPERLPDAWTLTKPNGARTLTATCELWTHLLGWEIRLLIDGRGLQMSGVVKTAPEMVVTVEEWRTAMTESGWS